MTMAGWALSSFHFTIMKSIITGKTLLLPGYNYNKACAGAFHD
jgi:hypothetical protein